MAETRTGFWLRRGRELDKMRKGELCAMYRQLGGLGGVHPPERWRKDEVVSSIVDIEWGRLPDGQKAPEPVRLTPPCDVCGGGEGAPAHEYGDHHYRYTYDPNREWVPYREADGADGRAEGQHGPECAHLHGTVSTPPDGGPGFMFTLPKGAEVQSPRAEATAWGEHRPEDPFPTAQGPIKPTQEGGEK